MFAKFDLSQTVPLAEIARTIGDRHRTVQRLYRALMILDQAEAARVYSLDDRTKKNLPFSHLYIGLDYPGFQQFLNLRPEEEEAKEPYRLRMLRIWVSFWFGCSVARKTKSHQLSEAKIPISVG